MHCSTEWTRSQALLTIASTYATVQYENCTRSKISKDVTGSSTKRMILGNQVPQMPTSIGCSLQYPTSPAFTVTKSGSNIPNLRNETFLTTENTPREATVHQSSYFLCTMPSLLHTRHFECLDVYISRKLIHGVDGQSSFRQTVVISSCRDRTTFESSIASRSIATPFKSRFDYILLQSGSHLRLELKI